jgi:hypothetical protein
MGRDLVGALGLGVVIAMSAAPAAAQVDIGVWTGHGGGRVIVGSPRVYVPAPVYVPPPVYVPAPVYVEPAYVYAPRVYVEPDYYYYRSFPPGLARGHYKNKHARGYYAPYASRVYRADVYARPYYRDNYYRNDRYRRR